MAFATSSIQEVFPGATITDSNLTIPSGSINSYIPLTTGNPTAYEMIFGLLDTISNAVSTGNLSSIVVSTSDSLSGSVLNKRYNFTVKVAYNSAEVVDSSNLIPEPTG